jgi:hypothetical protein
MNLNPFRIVATAFDDKRGLPQLIDEELQKARVERFEIRLVKEQAEGREATLSARIARLEQEQSKF